MDFGNLNQRRRSIMSGFSDNIEKARSGVYANTPENKKLGRVGQKYGASGGKEDPKGKPQKKQDPTPSKKEGGDKAMWEQHLSKEPEVAVEQLQGLMDRVLDASIAADDKGDKKKGSELMKIHDDMRKKLVESKQQMHKNTPEGINNRLDKIESKVDKKDKPKPKSKTSAKDKEDPNHYNNMDDDMQEMHDAITEHFKENGLTFPKSFDYEKFADAAGLGHEANSDDVLSSIIDKKVMKEIIGGNFKNVDVTNEKLFESGHKEGLIDAGRDYFEEYEEEYDGDREIFMDDDEEDEDAESLGTFDDYKKDLISAFTDAKKEATDKEEKQEYQDAIDYLNNGGADDVKDGSILDDLITSPSMMLYDLKIIR